MRFAAKNARDGRSGKRGKARGTCFFGLSVDKEELLLCYRDFRAFREAARGIPIKKYSYGYKKG